MPYCTMCEAWNPGRAAACEVCGGELSDERPQPATQDTLNLNLARDDPGYTQPEARALADAFETVRARAKGLAAAPESWLPAPGEPLAGALQLAITPDADRSAMTRLKEGLVDLQAFIPDDEAEAAQRFRAGSPWDDADRRKGEAALERVLKAQAATICWIRDDDRVLGAMNALRPLGGVVIGDGGRALAAVDGYKESQMAAFVSMVGGPFVVVIGAVVATVLLGFTAVGTGLAVVLAGAYFALGAAVGLAVGRLSSRAGRAARRLPGDRAATVAMALAEVMMVVALLLVPAALGFAAIGVCQALGLP